jgi:Fe-S cluster assembly ATP-binding protein
MALLEINNLHARVAAPGGKDILKGVNLTIERGEVHAIMGKNGSGKSTLSQVLAGRDAYEVTQGTITYDGKDLLELSAEERAREGIFLAFQYPVEIPGVSTDYFLKAAVNASRKHRGLPDLDAVEFIKLIKEKMALLKMDPSFMKRAINEGFSGGEKKRNEIFQMAVCNPTLALMDETDSGLDIDALKVVSHGANSLRGPDRAILLVTHYQRMLDYITPDYVHVMIDGRIVKTGDKSLALELEERGYDWVEKETQLV